MFLDHHEVDLKAQIECGWTVLHMLASTLHHQLDLDVTMALFTSLLEGGADPNIPDADGDTVLHVVVHKLNEKNRKLIPAMVATLLDSGVDPNLQNEAGERLSFTGSVWKTQRLGKKSLCGRNWRVC